jgi:hypothetical protein
MKDITTALLASLFVLVTLLSLISADPIRGELSGASFNSPMNASELHLRYALRR